MSSKITSSSTTSTTELISDSRSELKNENLQIFLGGSCNPTTWRQSVAIPFLEMNGITYYNPQVDNWTPEVVNIERYAKQNAKVLLFVIDKQTRSTVSLVESAFMAGQSKKLVLVIYPFEYNIIRLTDTTSNVIQMRSELMTTSRILKNRNHECSSSFTRASSSSSKTSSTLITSPSSIRYPKLESTTSISTATTSTSTNMTSKRVSTATKSDRMGQRKLESKHEKAEETCSTIKINGEVISSSEFYELRQARCMLQNLVALRNIPMFSDILHALKFISDNIDRKMSLSSNSSGLLDKIEQTNPLEHQPDTPPNITGVTTNNLDQKSSELKDIYLSLDGDDHTSLESSVISILQEKGLTYNFMFVNNIMRTRTMNAVPPPPPPPPPDLVDDLTRLSLDSQSIERSNKVNELTKYSSTSTNQADLGAQAKSTIETAIGAIRGSRVLLFVITNRCRGLSIMVLASHFMALFRDNVVLCLQYLEEPCLIGGEELTKAAIADYNRGRVYLSDYAIKSQVPVFNTIHEAIECCSKKCRFNNKN